MKALKRDKIPTPLQLLGTCQQDPTPPQESVKGNQSQLQSTKKDLTPTPLQELVKRNQSQLQSSKTPTPLQELFKSQLQTTTSEQDLTPLQELVKRNQPQLKSSKKRKIPTPRQLLIKEMPGETVPYSQVFIPQICISNVFWDMHLVHEDWSSDAFCRIRQTLTCFDTAG